MQSLPFISTHPPTHPLKTGQSNMQMTLSQALNSTAEIAAAGLDPSVRIRIMTLARNTSSFPLDDISTPPLLPWSVASPETVGGKDWDFFSAACYFFGRELAGEKGRVG